MRTERAQVAGSWLGVVAVLSAGACGGPASSAPFPLGTAGLPAAALVYEQETDGNNDLYLIPTGGGPAVRLTDHPASDGLARWACDGLSILFTSNQDGPECLWLMERPTGTVRNLVRHGNRTIMGNPHWSPAGERIVFSSNWRIGHQMYVVEVATGKQTRVSALTSGGCEPRFSRDGKRVVFVSRGHLGEHSRLVQHDLETGKVNVLVRWSALNYDPVYSPDGTEIAFASNITGEYAIYRQRLSDGIAQRVTFGKGPARYPD